jgi:hypothetical protein
MNKNSTTFEGMQVMEINGSQNQKRTTLLLVIGQVRCLKETCHFIHQNLVAPNPGTHVILSLDCFERDVDTLRDAGVLDVLGVDAVLYTDGRHNFTNSHAHVEFNLVWTGMKYGEGGGDYEFLIRTRTDLFTTIPFSMQSIFNPTEEDITTINDTSPSDADTIFTYIMCAGKREYRDKLQLWGSPWCYISQVDWNRDKIYLHINNRPFSSVSDTAAWVQQQHQTSYLVGSTWLHFGKWAQQRQLIETSTVSYGQLSFTPFGFSDTWQHCGHPVCLKNVTEAQIRLAHFTNALGMIDIVYGPDYGASFSGPRTVDECLQIMNKGDHYNFLGRC